MDPIEIYQLSRLHLTLGLAVACWLLWLWQRRRFYIFAIKFPGIWGWPIMGVGIALLNLNNFLTFLGEGFKRSRSSTYGTWFGTKYTIITQDAEFARHILRSPKFVDWADAMAETMLDAAGEGILGMNAPKWLTLRRMMLPCFQQKVMNSLLPCFNAKALIAVEKLSRLGAEGAPKLSRILHDVVAESAMTTILGCGTTTPFGKESKAYADTISDFIQLIPAYIRLSSANLFWITRFNFNFQRKKAYARDFMNKHLSARLEARCHMLQNTANNNDSEIIKDNNIYADLALNLYKAQELSWSEIITNSNNMMGASIETTSTAIFSTIVLLAMHQSVQQTLYEEISALFPDDEFEIKLEDLSSLQYLDMVVKETLRLFPSLPILTRKCSTAVQLDDSITLPKDVQVIISVHHVQRNKDYWGAHAHRFDPNNFLPEKVAQRHPYAFLPFAKGLRNCLGYRFAMYMIKIFIAQLIHKYRFTTTFKFDDIRVASHAVQRFLVEPDIQVQSRRNPKAYLISI